MGRGLSDHQKTILLLCLERPPCFTDPPKPPPPGVDLLAADAIRHLYGLKPQVQVWSFAEQCWLSTDRVQSFTDQRWDSADPAVKRAKTAVSRAFRRLEERGLVERWYGAGCRWAGICLTRDGVAAALEINCQHDADSEAIYAARLDDRTSAEERIKRQLETGILER